MFDYSKNCEKINDLFSAMTFCSFYYLQFCVDDDDGDLY